MTPASQRPTDPTPEPAPTEPIAEEDVAMGVREHDVTDKVLVVRAQSVKQADDMTPALAKIARKRGAAVLLVVGDVRLEALDDAQMLAAGWVRAQAEPEDEPTAAQLARVIEP